MKIRHYFGLGALTVLPLFMLVDVLGMLGWRTEGRVAPKESGGSLSPDQRAFLLEEYKTATGEIRLRIEHEHTMIALKFTLVGAVLGVILYAQQKSTTAAESPIRSTWAALCCWAAIVVSAIVDLRRQTNVDAIAQLGNWVGSIESQFLPGPIGWEHYVADRNPFWSSPFYPLLRVERELLTWALYLLAIMLFVPHRDDEDAKAIDGIARLFGSVTFVLFGLYALHFHYQRPPGGWLYSLGCTVLGILLMQWWIGFSKKRASPIS